MKKLLLLLIIPILSFGQYTYVPDDNFEQRLIDLFFDDVLDDYVLTENISSVEELYICCSNISDLTGIEDFINIKTLDCNFNPDLLSLDLSNNTELISISANQISGTENGSLEYIDVSNCPNLETLTCLHAQVSSVDVSNSPNLIVLNIGHNEIETIDVTNNIYLETLIVDNNLISEIDVTNNINLNTLDISDNINLVCADIRNGNNTEITGFYATGNWNLNCINVDDASYSNNNWTNILDQNYFSEDCENLCNENFCEGVSVELESFNELNIEVLISTENNPNFWCSYCGLTLEDNDGNIIAVENPWTAPSFYGLAGGYIELRTLDLIQNISFPFQGVLNAVNGLMPNVNVDENFIIDVNNPIDMKDGDIPFIMCSWPLELNNNSELTDDFYENRIILKTIDILGRDSYRKGFDIEIYDDGSVQKKYVIE